MNDKRKTPRTSDTLPAKGRVTEVCKEWLVHEDGALAYQLQKQEVEEHYTGNKTRNAQVREDLPRAKEEQQREERDAFARYQERLQHQAEQDEYLAMKVAENLEREEERERRRRELQDEEIARRIQEKEQDRIRAVGHVQNVGLPLSTENSDVTSHMRSLNLNSADFDDESPTSMDFRCVLNDSELQEEAQRRLQEQKDEELARLLQEQDSGSLSLEDKDRLLAMEAQDKELARLLHEKEKARARRARERAKQKALLKKQQALEQQQNQSSMASCSSADASCSNADELHSSRSLDVGTANGREFHSPKGTEAHSQRRLDVETASIREFHSPKGTEAHSPRRLDVGTAKGREFHSPKGTEAHSPRSSEIEYNSRGSDPDPDFYNSRSSNSSSRHSRGCHERQCSTESEVQESSFIETPSHIVRGQDQVLTSWSPETSDRRYYDDNKLEVCTLNNIATAIDPTFSSLTSQIACDTEKCVAPPYMPIQGQRRTSSLEKKSKKKDGCKTQ